MWNSDQAFIFTRYDMHAPVDGTCYAFRKLHRSKSSGRTSGSRYSIAIICYKLVERPRGEGLDSIVDYCIGQGAWLERVRFRGVAPRCVYAE